MKLFNFVFCAERKQRLDSDRIHVSSIRGLLLRQIHRNRKGGSALKVGDQAKN